MNTGWRKGISWTISLILHAVLLLLVSVPGGGLSAGSGLEVIEVGFVELGPTAFNGRAQQTPVKPAQKPQTNEAVKALPKDSATKPPLQETSDQKQVPTDLNQEPAHSAHSENSGTGNNGGASQGTQGGNKGQGLGSGEGFVLSRPITYPKNAQNEGSEGEVSVEVRLTPEGEIQVVLLSASGDQRLDSYSLRALKEAWQYARPAFPVKIRIAIIFRNGEVKVVFQGSEQWERSDVLP